MCVCVCVCGRVWTQDYTLAYVPLDEQDVNVTELSIVTSLTCALNTACTHACSLALLTLDSTYMYSQSASNHLCDVVYTQWLTHGVHVSWNDAHNSCIYIFEI